MNPVSSEPKSVEPKTESVPPVNCPYCGRTNAAEAFYCSECGTILQTRKSETGEGSELEPAPAGIATEFEWTARDAWKCVGMLLVFTFAEKWVLLALAKTMFGSRYWLVTNVGWFTSSLVTASVLVLTSAYFERTETWPCFVKAFGLQSPPGPSVWSVLLIALVFQGVSWILVSARAPAHPHLGQGASYQSVSELLFYLSILVLPPLSEEVCFRGFLYPALRGSYPMAPSMGIILVLTVVPHLGRPVPAIAAVGVFGVFLCYVRERTGGLWECIIAHGVFNFSALLFAGH